MNNICGVITLTRENRMINERIAKIRKTMIRNKRAAVQLDKRIERLAKKQRILFDSLCRLMEYKKREGLK